MARLLLGATVGGNTAWHAGNDGPGSGLNTELVDSVPAVDLLAPYGSVIADAVWHVDAAVVGSDRLIDLSGGDRDAIFGTDTAAPLVLPWNSRTYLYIPGTDTVSIQMVPTGQHTATEIVMEVTEIPQGIHSGLFTFGPGGAAEGWAVAVLANGSLQSAAWDAAVTFDTQVSAPAVFMHSSRYHRFTRTSNVIVYAHSTDGATWIDAATLTHAATHASVSDSQFYFNLAYGLYNGTGMTLWHGSVTVSGTTISVLDPANVAATYQTITNTGVVGGDWSVNRGYGRVPKSVVVDRPVLLFSGAQTMTVPNPVAGLDSCTLMFAQRITKPDESEGIARSSVSGPGALSSYFSSNGPGMLHAFVDNSALEHVGYVGADNWASRVGIHTVVVRPDGTVSVYSSNGTVQNGAGLDVTLSVNPLSFAENACSEFCAAVIWDRALTDAEVTLASQELSRGYMGTVVRQHQLDNTADMLKTYIDEIVTTTTVDPDPVANVPVRDGLVWYVVDIVSVPKKVVSKYVSSGGEWAEAETLTGQYVSFQGEWIST